MRKKQKGIDPQRRHPNVLLYHEASPAKIAQTTVMFRQFICYNLTEKFEVNRNPFLMSEIEKKWLIFLLLCGVAQIHSVDQVHGDIKPENVLITSYDWLLIADMHSYKPVFLALDDQQTYNQYFGDLGNNTRCYIAPERWYAPQEQIDKNQDLKPSMDVFSAGCVIAEILMNGYEPLFSLATLRSYKRGTHDPSELLKKYISDQKMIKLILSMINKDPKLRPSINECLSEWNKNIFPCSFSRVLFQIGASFQQLQNVYSDNKISLIRFHIDSIFETCLGEFGAIKTFQEPIEPSIYNLLQHTDFEQLYDQLQPKIKSEFNFYYQSKDEDQMCQRQTDIKGYEKDSLLIVVLWLGNMFQSCFYPQSKLVALEMIQKMSKFIPFQTRLNLVLPLVQTALADNQTDTQNKKGSTSKVKAKALDVLLGLFFELEKPSVEEIYIESLDYKVAFSYILPIIKRLMDSSKNDQLVRLSIASNVGRIARIMARFLEVSISSCSKRRNDAIQRKKEAKNDITPEQLMSQLGSMHITNFGNFRSTFAQKREDLLQVEIINPNEIIEEDVVSPNYDLEMDLIWKEIQQLIETTIGSKEQEDIIIIAILGSLIELSKVFGVDKADFLIQQCLSGVNKKNFMVRKQALKTLTGISFSVGEKKVDEYILPLVEQLLEDPEDLIVIENLKTINFMVMLRLIQKKKCIELLEKKLVCFLLYPNQKIRHQVAIFICQLYSGDALKLNGQKCIGRQDHELVQLFGQTVTICKKPLLKFEEFYCLIRPTLITLFKECHQHEIMSALNDPELLLSKLREPLNPKIMRAYFQKFTKPSIYNQLEKSSFYKNEDRFMQINSDEFDQNDHYAFNFLRDVLKNKLKQLQKKTEEKKQVDLNKQQQATVFLYRVMKQNTVQKIATGYQIDGNQNSILELTDDEKASIIREFSCESDQGFTTQLPVSSETNFGMNKPSQIPLPGIPYEIEQILKSLEVVPQIPETKNFKNLKAREKGEMSRLLRVNSEIRLAPRGAQASIIDQFDYLPLKQTIGFKVGDDYRKEVQNIKGDSVKNFRPQGTLITTLYDHTNPVNTVAVSENQQFFMTGSRGDKAIFVYSVKNIAEDLGSSVVQINSQSSLNQICTVQNSNILAAATEKGIELYDMNRIFTGVLFEDQYEMRSLNLDEVVQLQSMQTPISYDNILVAATQTGSMLIYDLRQRQPVLTDQDVFVKQRGAVSAMCIGKDAFSITVGTLGGYIANYDLRYGVQSALFKHHLNQPVLAMASYRRPNLSGNYYYCNLVSMGGPQFEMCQLNMESGQIDTLYRINNQPSDLSVINKNEITNVPEFFVENSFKDNKFGTLKRDLNSRLFERQLLYLNQSKFDIQTNRIDGLVNQDYYFMDASRNRFKRISESYGYQLNEKPVVSNVCRSILIPRDKFQSTMFENETAEYAITAGSDMKIRYWDLYSPETLSYQINSPQDDEVSYVGERITKTTKVVMEKLNSQKDFPKLTSARIKDQTSTASQYLQKNGSQVWVKYAENTACKFALFYIFQITTLLLQSPLANSLVRIWLTKLHSLKTRLFNKLIGLNTKQKNHCLIS